MHQWSRRDFLRLTGGGTLLLTVAGTGLLAACDPTALEDEDANGVKTQPGFTSRIIATTGARSRERATCGTPRRMVERASRSRAVAGRT